MSEIGGELGAMGNFAGVFTTQQGAIGDVTGAISNQVNSSPTWWKGPRADRMRQDLHGGGHARLSAAKWRIGNETAVLVSGYKMQGSEVEAGMLTADLVWREGRWLVTGVSMERAR